MNSTTIPTHPISGEVILNDLLEDLHITDLRDVKGLARRAIAGLQVLRDRAYVEITEVLPSGRVYSNQPGQLSDHGFVVRIEGQALVGYYGSRKVTFSAYLPVYETVGGAPDFRGYEGGDVAFDLVFEVTSEKGESTEFALMHGFQSTRAQMQWAEGDAWSKHPDQIYCPVEAELPPDEEYELPEVIANLVRDVVQRLCERTLLALLARE